VERKISVKTKRHNQPHPEVANAQDVFKHQLSPQATPWDCLALTLNLMEIMGLSPPILMGLDCMRTRNASDEQKARALAVTFPETFPALVAHFVQKDGGM
jgi:hypothetical protein